MNIESEFYNVMRDGFNKALPEFWKAYKSAMEDGDSLDRGFEYWEDSFVDLWYEYVSSKLFDWTHKNVEVKRTIELKDETV